MDEWNEEEYLEIQAEIEMVERAEERNFRILNGFESEY